MSACGVDQHVGGVGEALGELLDHPGVLGQDLFGSGCSKIERMSVPTMDWAALGTLVEHVAHEVDPAALPGWPRAAPRRWRRRGPVGVGDDEGHPGQPPGHQAAQKRRPARPVLGGDEVETEDLSVAVGVHPGGHDDRHVHDPAALAHLLGEGVEPDVGVGTGVEGTVAEGGHLLVEGLGELGDLGLGDPVDAHGLARCRRPGGSRPLRRSTGRPPRRGPARPGAAARAASRGSSCRRGASGWPARSCRPGCRSPWSDSRCASSPARG